MINDFSKIFVKAKLEALARKNNVDFSKFFSCLNTPTTIINDHDNIVGNYSIQNIRSLFNGNQEKVFIKDFESGLRLDMSDTLFSSVVSIGRNQIILDMLENGNAQELISSLQNNQVSMFEVDGKYYAENDGNHRLMALKILYYLEKAKNPQLDESKFSFITNVKHIIHTKELIDSLTRYAEQQKKSLFFDYLMKDMPYSNSIYNVIKYNKEQDKYEVDLRGIYCGGLDEKQVIKLLDSYKNEKPYSIYKTNNGYALEFGNILVVNLKKEKLQNAIENLKSNKTEFSNEYKIVKKNDKFDLIIEAKKYYDKPENLKNIYSACVNFNQKKPLQEMTEQKTDCQILSEKEISKIYFENLDYIDIELDTDKPFIQIGERIIEDISKQELDIRLNQLNKERMFCKTDNFLVSTKLIQEQSL